MTEAQKCDSCDNEASVQLQEQGTVHVYLLCMAHGQELKARSEAVLKTVTLTSIVHRDPSEKELLAVTHEQLEDTHDELLGARAAVARLERELNVADQTRQARDVELGRKVVLIEELSTQLIKASAELDQVRAQLESANQLLDSLGVERGTTHERVEGSQVETLTGVDAGSNADGPTSEAQR